jgi:hypothetical protein
MVFLIKSNTYVRNNSEIDKICKTMINIEQNRNIFNVDGIENDIKNTNIPFNSYTYKNIEYNITTSVGVVVIYVNNSHDDVTFTNLSHIMIEKFNQLNINSINTSDKLPISTYTHKSTYHTLVTSNNNIIASLIPTSTSTLNSSLSYRKLINNVRDFKKACESGTRFVWYIRINHRQNKSYLSIVESSEKMPDKIYLMRSISTIIHDGNDIFNIKNNTKQINYPSLDQYNIHKDNKIIESPVHINQIYGLDYEIISHFSTNVEYVSKFNMLYKILESHKLVNYKDFKLRRLNRDKLWYVQISETFNYDTQEFNELKSDETGKPIFPNDVCYITGMPIYKHCYILKVGLKKEDQKNQEDIYDNICHIMVAPYAYHSCALFHHFFNSTGSYSIIETYISEYPRTEAEVIDLIPSNKIDNLKRNLLKCISLNGSCLKNTSEFLVSRLYTFDIDTKIIYIGYENISDSDVIRHKDTKNILFRYISD